MSRLKVTVVRPKLLIFIIVSLFIGFIVLFVHLAKQTFTSCAELRKDGRVNIVKGDPDYNFALDSDRDAIACEA